MRPIVTDRVARSVGLSVCYTSDSAKTAEPIEMAFGLWTRMGPRNHVRWGSRSPHGKGKLWEKGAPIIKCRNLCRELCKNGWTYRFVVWVAELGGPKEE